MLPKKLRIVGLALLLITGLLLVACGGAAPAGEEEAAPAEEEEMAEEEAAPAEEEEMAEEGGCTLDDEDGVVTFGNAAHLTGWMSAYDGPPRQGAITAVRVLNEQGGIAGCEVDYIELDGQTDVATLGNITLQLIDEGADAILAPCDFDMGAAAGQAAQENGLVAVSTCASSPLYGSEALGDLNFTESMWNTTMGAAAAEFAYNEKGWQTAYVMTDTTIEYDTSLAQYFIETFEHLGGTVLAEDEFLQDDPDIAALIQRFQEVQDEVDVLFISSYMPGVAAAIRQVRSAGIDTPLMGGDSWDTEELYGALGPDIGNNIWVSTHSWVGEDSPDPNMATFRTEFEKDWDEPPSLSFHTMGWDSVMAIAQAMEDAGTTEGSAVAKAMEEPFVYHGLSGDISWSSAADGHYPHKEAFIINVEGSSPSFVQKILPSWLPEP